MLKTRTTLVALCLMAGADGALAGNGYGYCRDLVRTTHGYDNASAVERALFDFKYMGEITLCMTG